MLLLHSFEYEDTSWDRRPYAPPPGPKASPWLLPRDWGRSWYPLPWASYGSDIGVFLGAGFTTMGYGFRKEPSADQHTLRAGWAFGASQPRVDYQGEFHRTGSGVYTGHFARYSGLDVLRYYGFGNETTANESDDFYKAQARQLTFVPSLTVPVAKCLELTLAPALQYSDTREGDRLVDQEQPYGVGSFGQLDRRSVTVEYPYAMSRGEFEAALQRVADSAKRTSGARAIGRLGIGIFSFQQIGCKCTFYSRKSLAAETIEVVLKEGHDEAQVETARARDRLPAPCMRVVISDLNFDPARPRGPLAPDTLRRYLGEKFEAYLREGWLEIAIVSGVGQFLVLPPKLGLPRLLNRMRTVSLPDHLNQHVGFMQLERKIRCLTLISKNWYMAINLFLLLSKC